MLFNSYLFIFAFLPIVLAVYALLNHYRLFQGAKGWLALASLIFYGWWNVKFVPLLLLSIAFNFMLGRALRAFPSGNGRKCMLGLGLIVNLLALGLFKYADFAIVNWNHLTGQSFPLPGLALPLGISFFTFTQIAYLVDAYRSETSEYSIVNYVLFVTFFPHLISGPILHHKEMIPQFDRLRNKVWNWKHIHEGSLRFAIGLAKKMVLADSLAVYANSGFASASGFLDSWVAALAYTLQLYFDFSGYTDMAIGAALLFNIRLPENFSAPYLAVGVQDFWRRWHMTLSRFLRDYIYIPLGGSRKGFTRALFNVMLTFLIGGIWHGAGWMFILWGLLHGAAQAAERVWKRWGFPLPRRLAWLLTFGFLNITWVFFRAETQDTAIRLLKGMAGFSGSGIKSLPELLGGIVLIAILLYVTLRHPLQAEKLRNLRPGPGSAVVMAVLMIVSLMFFSRISVFLYFNF
ncbi:MBOAT family protein [Paenibacillus sp. HN-1]|uniref:MBOAT family O-acyltransferase n=1 Tax=Paenibacillus TaxID=44249 RepID=UPI001CA89DC7|nr:MULTISPECIES: MBOAT family protein [Paenibacillus]MBY9081604.1 MBOAT family protein [Paenibacillus sp. CGMCC 1.18879]MBY9083473.1 MBOAT family protein [Paenibacillus sinensis]